MDLLNHTSNKFTDVGARLATFHRIQEEDRNHCYLFASNGCILTSEQTVRCAYCGVRVCEWADPDRPLRIQHYNGCRFPGPGLIHQPPRDVAVLDDLGVHIRDPRMLRGVQEENTDRVSCLCIG